MVRATATKFATPKVELPTEQLNWETYVKLVTEMVNNHVFLKTDLRRSVFKKMEIF